MDFLLRLQPAGLAVDNVAPPKKEGLDPPKHGEEKSGQSPDQNPERFRFGSGWFDRIFLLPASDEDGDVASAAGLASPAAAEAIMLNGMDSDDGSRHADLTVSAVKMAVNENGTAETETPHGSVTGSNGFILAKEQQQDGDAAPASGASSPLRTNRLPSGSPPGGQTAKPLNATAAAGCAQSSGALRTAPGTGNMSDAKNGFASSPVTIPPPVTVHRARKTMSRPAVSPAQKVRSPPPLTSEP